MPEPLGDRGYRPLTLHLVDDPQFLLNLFVAASINQIEKQKQYGVEYSDFWLVIHKHCPRKYLYLLVHLMVTDLGGIVTLFHTRDSD